MRAVRKKPGELPEIVEIDDTMEALKEELGGEPEFLRFAIDAAGVVRKDSETMQPNIIFCGYPVDGTLLVIGWDAYHASSLPLKYVGKVMKHLGRKELWRS